MKLKKLGHFRELAYGDTESIYEVLEKPNYSNKVKVLEYLARGKISSVSPCLVTDVLSGEVIAPLEMKTDGKWSWGSDLLHYVSQYNITLPTEFLTDAANWDGADFNVNISEISGYE